MSSPSDKEKAKDKMKSLDVQNSVIEFAAASANGTFPCLSVGCEEGFGVGEGIIG